MNINLNFKYQLLLITTVIMMIKYTESNLKVISPPELKQILSKNFQKKY